MIRATTSSLVGLVVCLLAASRATATVEEVASMATALASADSETLVVLDIDNTLLRPASYLGSDAWYEWLVKRGVERGRTRDVAVDEAMAAWNDAQYVVDVVPVEAGTAAAVSAARAKGARIIALTARTKDIAERTLAQLKSIGIELGAASQARVAPPGGFLLGGVLFVGDHADKGQQLVTLLSASGVHPKRVIFVDDKQRHAVAVDKALTAVAIPCRAFRYGAADDEVARFWRDVADVAFLVDGAPSIETQEKIAKAKPRGR